MAKTAQTRQIVTVLTAVLPYAYELCAAWAVGATNATNAIGATGTNGKSYLYWQRYTDYYNQANVSRTNDVYLPLERCARRVSSHPVGVGIGLSAGIHHRLDIVLRLHI
jgi:hypothetical protein